MSLSIISWNTRNLSRTIARQGTRGRGLALEHRIKCITQNIIRWNADIVFILEAGPDNAEVASFINDLVTPYHYNAVPSEITAGEGYIMVFKSHLATCFGNFRMVGGTNEYFRKGWMIPIYLRQGINSIFATLVVLHAPSPSFNLTQRIEIINAVVKDAKLKANNLPIILTGDFNIQRDKLDHLDNLLHTQEKFQFDGPKDANGVVVSTSLRKYTTISKGVGFHETSDSQPYDQFWSIGFSGTNEVSIPHFEVSQIVVNHLLNFISEGMEDLANLSKNEPPPSPSPLNNYEYDKNCALYGDFKWFETLHAILNREGRTRDQINVILKGIPIKQWLKYINTIHALVEKYNLKGLDNGKITLDFAVFLFLKYILDEFVFFMKLADSVINCRTGGIIGCQISQKATFEFSISDHMPILMHLHDYSPTPLPPPGPGPMGE
ncbi:MAG: endonuclease/exonuclease/phosphatase family protein [Bacteroidota bacterium]